MKANMLSNFKQQSMRNMIKEKSSFIMPVKVVKYLGINVKKEK